MVRTKKKYQPKSSVKKIRQIVRISKSKNKHISIVRTAVKTTNRKNMFIVTTVVTATKRKCTFIVRTAVTAT